MFDAHCHLDRMNESLDAVLNRSRAAGVTHWMIAGVDPLGWETQISLIQPGVSIGIGIHPWKITDNASETERDLMKLESFVDEHKGRIRAIGETGLDFGKRIAAATHTNQRASLRRHIRLASRHRLPLILHAVSAHEATLEILQSECTPLAGGMVHSFSGSRETAERYLSLGLHLSFSAAIADPNRRKLHRALASIPDDALLVETDCPDQTPLKRRPSPNEPAFLIDVIAAAAEIRDQPIETVRAHTTRNALALFGP